MKWYSNKDGYVPLSSEKRVLTYSEAYKDSPEMAFRVMDYKFVSICKEVTHFAYLDTPKDK